ncbi:unnamed protein product [Moneuplotes crassus]|uniref:Uncharacterized protein n=1 Tax=Euplotes crassus TaxID=5936 RepID=A0AAD1XAS3_EUPCR|nr:unnamed protein product [Moneuplotes crassus]
MEPKSPQNIGAEQHRKMNEILDQELCSWKYQQDVKTQPAPHNYGPTPLDEASPILIHKYSNQKPHLDDPTLCEVLGQISTPENADASELFPQNNENKGEYRINRQLLQDYKSSIKKERSSNDLENSMNDSHMSISLMPKNEESISPTGYKDEKPKLTMSMLTKDQPASSGYSTEKKPKKNSTYSKVQKDLKKLKAKIKRFENKCSKHLDETNTKDIHDIEENCIPELSENDETQPFESLQKDHSYEFISSDAKAMTFNNDKNDFKYNLESSGEISSRKRFLRKVPTESSFMNPTKSSKKRSISNKKKIRKVVRSKTYRTLSSTDSDNSFQETSKFKKESPRKKKIPLSIEISSDSEDKENKATFRNYRAILEDRKRKDPQHSSSKRRRATMNKSRATAVANTTLNKSRSKSKKSSTKPIRSEFDCLKAEVTKLKKELERANKKCKKLKEYKTKNKDLTKELRLTKSLLKKSEMIRKKQKEVLLKHQGTC